MHFLARFPRLAALLLPVLMPFLLTTGCSTFVSDPALLNPDAKPATIHCYTRLYVLFFASCAITAVDGHRTDASEVLGLTAKLASGLRWVEFQTDNYFGGAGGTSEVCAFTFNFQESHEYQIKAHSLKFDPVNSSDPDELALQSGQVDIQEGDPWGGAIREFQVPITCSHGGGSLCRAAPDCVTSRYIRCVPHAPHPFGRCEPVMPDSDR